jgi:hypothetical protein
VSFLEPRLPFARTPRESCDQFHDSRVEIGMGRSGVDVAPGQGESRTGRESLSAIGPVVPAEHDIRRQHVTGKARHLRELMVHEFR